MKHFIAKFLVVILVSTSLKCAQKTVPPAGILPAGENAFVLFKVMLPVGTDNALVEVTRRIEFPQNDTEAVGVLQDQINRQQRVIDGETAQNSMNLPVARASLPVLQEQLNTVKQRLSEEGKTAEGESKKVFIHTKD